MNKRVSRGKPSIFSKMSEIEIQLKKFQLVKFKETKKDGTSTIDCVPCSWIRYDHEKGNMLAKFAPPPYHNKKARQLLESMIKSQSSALPSWPEYVVELVGHADTYENSIERLGTLENDSFAYTTDSDHTGQEKASQITEQIKKQSLQKIMEVPRIESDGSGESGALSSQTESDSSREDIPATPVCRKIKKDLAKQKKKVTDHQSRGQNYSSSKSSKNRFHVNQNPKTVKKVKTVKPVELSQRPTSRTKSSSKRDSNPLGDTTPSTVHTNINVLERAVKSTKSIKVSQQPTSQTKNSPNTASNTVEDAPSIVSTDVDSLEGEYILEESGALVREASCPKQDISQQENWDPTGDLQELPVPPAQKMGLPRLCKTPIFNQRLSNAADMVHQASKAYTKDTMLIIHTLKGLCIDLQENTNAINNLCAAVQASRAPSHADAKKTALVFQSDFELPFQTLQEFKDFDNQLSDPKYRQHCADSLLFYIDHDNQVPKSVTNIIKRFVGHEVTLQFTAIKQMGQKEVFKNTKFCNVMFDVITQNHKDNQGKPISEKYFFQCLGHSIANAKDWDGCRIQRVKK